MNSTETTRPTSPSTIAQNLQQAVALHQAGELQEAKKLYRAILQIEPNHPEANHNMGVLAVQIKQPAAGLAHFMVALQTDPARGQYWLSYIDALYQSGQMEDARQVLAMAQQQGLQGDEIEALALLLQGDTGDALAVASPNSQRGKKTSGAKTHIVDKSAGKSVPHNGKEPSPQEINALVALFNQGRLTEAENLAQTMTVRFPQHWVGWKMLGVVFNQLGKTADALVPMQKTVALLPDDAEAHNNLGITLQDMGRLDKAESSYRRALKINPDYAQAHSNLGSVLQKKEQLNEAEASYRRAIKINPDYAKAHNNLGSILQGSGRLDEAEASYRHALQIKPDYAEALNNLGLTLKNLGRLDEAEASYLHALQIKPDYAEAHFNLGGILKELGQLDEAEASYRRALQIKPDYAEAHSMLGVVLYRRGRIDGAEASYRRALQLNPDSADILNNLGIIHNDLCRLDDAEASYRRALEIRPDYATAHSNLGGVLHDLGRLEEAEECWRQALKYRPDLAEAHSNLLFCLAQVGAMDAQALFAEHCRFGDQFEAPFRDNFLQHGNSRDPARCLQVGIVSGDFRNHAMAYFIEMVLTHLSAFSQLSLHAYSNHVAEDNVTQRLRGYFAHWHQIDSLTDAALADKIRADGIDILIDLSGHTAKNRLLTFARKPAPIQISWMGYPGTTGLHGMDYFLADRFLLPPGRFEDQFTEKIVRLPATGPFLPYKDAPPVSPLPALSNGHVTFGSFNRLSKLSHEVIALWSQLLRALPDSRLLLGGMPEKGKYAALLDWFAQESIARERLDFHPRSDMPGYLRLHQQVDICLDTFPYNGGTTTFHAMWMGVPTLSLSGKTAAGRSGAAILGNVGLEAFVADDAAGFVHKGVSWAGKLDELSAIRAGLRERMANSAAGQPQLIAASLERALRIMWQRWCAGMPADSFEVTRQEIEDALPGGKK